MFLRLNVTSIVQPIDQNVIQVKLLYRKRFLKRIVPSKDAYISKELKKVNLRGVVIGLAKTWENVGPALIQKTLNKLLTQDDDTWSEDYDIPY